MGSIISDVVGGIGDIAGSGQATSGSALSNLVSGIGDIVGSEQASDASSNASSAITANILQALNYEQAGLNTATGVETPYAQAGTNLLSQATLTGDTTYSNATALENDAMGAYNGGNVALSPTTQYQEAQGATLLNQQLASRGLYNSGAAIAGLSNMDANLVSQNYQNAFTNANTANQTGASLTNPLLFVGSSNAQSIGGQAVTTGTNQANTSMGGTEAAAGYTAQAGLQQGTGTIGAANQFGNMGSDLMQLGSFADGGRPPVGQPYVVGEKGPEIRVDDKPGTIIPNQIAGLSVPGSAMPRNKGITDRLATTAGEKAYHDEVIKQHRSMGTGSPYDASINEHLAKSANLAGLMAFYQSQNKASSGARKGV